MRFEYIPAEIFLQMQQCFLLLSHDPYAGRRLIFLLFSHKKRLSRRAAPETGTAAAKVLPFQFSAAVALLHLRV
ncbi:MAG: hypothetical protein IJL32_11825 [Oscillospiraceae bacterium]|nr:hypothetical protein [Oscillospiraceae bacterium]